MHRSKIDVGFLLHLTELRWERILQSFIQIIQVLSKWTTIIFGACTGFRLCARYSHAWSHSNPHNLHGSSYYSLFTDKKTEATQLYQRTNDSITQFCLTPQLIARISCQPTPHQYVLEELIWGADIRKNSIISDPFLFKNLLNIFASRPRLNSESSRNI